MEKDNKTIQPELLKAQAGYTVLYQNILIYEKDNPAKKIDQKIDNIEIKENSLILIPSPVLFYGLRKLYSKLPDNCFVLCLEWEKQLYDLKEKPESEYFSEISYINITNPGFFLNFFDNRKELSFIKHIVFLPLNKGYLLHKDFYAECYDNLKKNLKQFLKNSLTLYSLGQRYYKNLILNLPVYAKEKDIKQLKIDKPVVITGAGESLEKALPILKSNREFLKIIAIDTSLKTLINSNIIPDFVIAVESQLYNIFDFMGNNSSSISLIADMTTYPLTSRIFNSSKYYFTSNFTSSKFLDKLKKEKLLPEIIPPLGSVGITALYIASIISASFIFYTGLDFCFTTGKTHAKDSPAIINSLVNLTRLSGETNYNISVKGNLIGAGEYCNKTFYTTPVLKSYSEIMYNIISKNKKIYSLFFPGIVVKNSNNIADEQAFLSMLNNADKELDKNPAKDKITADYNIDIVNRTEKIKTILENELGKIEIIINSGIDFLNGVSQEKNQNIIKQFTEESDYLLPYYPSVNYSKDLDSVTVKFILLSCYSFKKTIKNTLNII